MDNDLWPVVREASRRILRLENILFQTPKKFISEFNLLCEKISDNIPSRLVFPEIEFIEKDVIIILHRNSENNDYQKIIEIGKFEPSVDVCWIECEIEDGWKWLIETCLELLEAGYPGCTGCGGTNSERQWDEKKFRENRKSGEDKIQ